MESLTDASISIFQEKADNPKKYWERHVSAILDYNLNQIKLVTKIKTIVEIYTFLVV